MGKIYDACNDASNRLVKDTNFAYNWLFPNTVLQYTGRAAGALAGAANTLLKATASTVFVGLKSVAIGGSETLKAVRDLVKAETLDSLKVAYYKGTKHEGAAQQQRENDVNGAKDHLDKAVRGAVSTVYEGGKKIVGDLAYGMGSNGIEFGTSVVSAGLILSTEAVMAATKGTAYVAGKVLNAGYNELPSAAKVASYLPFYSGSQSFEGKTDAIIQRAPALGMRDGTSQSPSRALKSKIKLMME